MSATIKQERIFSFNSNIEFKVTDNNILVNGGVFLNPIMPPSNKDIILLVVDYNIEPYIVPEGVKLEANIILPFTLKPRLEITIQDLYHCVSETRKRFQIIFDSIFMDIGLIVPPIGFDLLEEELKIHLSKILQG